jgi:hypothetical protein
MAQTAKKINFMINDDIRKEFEELVPPGIRSKVVNEALKKELISIRRKRLTHKLLSIRATGSLISTDEIVEALKIDRSRDK